MDKTININLGGTLFNIDEEAYRILRDYLLALSNKFRNIPGGNETVDDIESRIAEIFLSQKSTAGVISRANVEDMIYIIGKPEDFTEPEDVKRETGHSYTYGKRMLRNTHDRIIGGVCGGIGNYLNTDPVWFRIFFVFFSLMFGIGILVYLALWVALPASETGSPRKDLYGTSLSERASTGSEAGSYKAAGDIGNAFNEIFRAVGKVLWIIVRVMLILLGISVIVAGFLGIVAFIMVFVFRFPGAFSTDYVGMNISYLPDFLNYVVTPAMVPWIKVLTTIGVILPLMVLIYLGVRMIFWFRAKDGAFLLTGLILWVLSVTVLSILLFNEGISFAETARSASRDYFKTVPDTLWIKSASRISDLSVDNEISIPEEGYFIFIDEDSKQLYIRTRLEISPAEEKSAWVDITKRSSGRSKMDATRKADRLQYNHKITGDTLFLDEYFNYPESTKWSFDEVSVDIKVPAGTIIKMDETIEKMLHDYDDYDFENDRMGGCLIMTEDGPDHINLHQGTRP